MTDQEWLKLIEEKEEEIIKVGINAYTDARNNSNARYIVEINDNGIVSYWSDMAGGNSFHASTHYGSSTELFQFCFQHSDVVILEENIIDKLIINGYERLVDELMKEAVEENSSLEMILVQKDNKFKEIVNECKQEEIDWDICEYAEEQVKVKIEHVKECLENSI